MDFIMGIILLITVISLIITGALQCNDLWQKHRKRN